ncbi:MAG: tetratricopeptide repeat protein [Verrucomicrobia bacterium]|nr:tetratricopeptide repeat protein [Verrucomicrobiota bacterium]
MDWRKRVLLVGLTCVLGGGAALFSEDKPPVKEEVPKELVKLDPAEEVKLGRGMAFQAFSAEQQEAWRPAKDLYTAALEKAPEIPWIRLRRGFCEIKLEDEEAARADFAKAISQGISTDKADASNDLQFLITVRSRGGPLAEFRDPKATIALSRRLVELERSTDHVLLEAACLAESEQYLRAQEVLLARLREVEDAADKERLQTAVETFRRQSKFGPALEGLELEKEGKFSEAMDRYTNVLDQAPDTAWVLVRRAFCLAKTGDPAGAKADLRRAMRLMPETATDRVTIAWAKASCPFLEFRDGAGAVSLAKRALQDEPLIPTYGILASGYAEMGDFRRAQETTMLALSKTPTATEKKDLERKLALFREKKAEMDNWAPKASPTGESS